MKMSIVIPNYNGEKYLSGCLKSIDKQTQKIFETIVVDNGSSDTSIDIISNFSKVKLIRNKKNLGFSKAVNIGIKEAKGDLIALLNNDTELDNSWAEKIVEAAQAYPKAGFFASKMLDYYHHDIIDSAGDGLSWSGRAFNIGRGKKNTSEFFKKKFVFGACGGSAVYRKEIFEKVGYFDEDFFMYLEDVDFSFRAQSQGFKCLFVPEAKVFHLGAATSGGKKSAFAFKYINKNRWHLIYKNYPLRMLLLHMPAIMFSEILFFVAAIRHFFLKEYCWAVINAFLEHKKMIKKRKTIQKSRVISLKYLNQILG